MVRKLYCVHFCQERRTLFEEMNFCSSLHQVKTQITFVLFTSLQDDFVYLAQLLEEESKLLTYNLLIS